MNNEKGFASVPAETPGGEGGESTGAIVPAFSGSLGTIIKSEIDVQIATAKSYPRFLKAFKTEATEMVTLTAKVAAECMYALPRKEKDPVTGQMVKKTIEGPSARFAEIVLSAWGNARAGGRVIGEEGDHVVCQGFFFDVQKNVMISLEVRRRIVDRNGRRYSPDMIGVTANAGCSIAKRNAVLQGIPKAFWSEVYDAGRKTAIGDAKTLSARRDEMLAYFAKMGVSREAVLEKVGVEGIEDVGLDELAELLGLATAIKEGDTSVDQAFPKTSAPEKGKATGTEGAKDKIRKARQPAAGAKEFDEAKVAKFLGDAKTLQELGDAWSAHVPDDIMQSDREAFDRLTAVFYEKEKALKGTT